MITNIDSQDRPGLGTEPQDRWPKVSDSAAFAEPIDLLRPNSEAHKRVMTYLNERLDYSERTMKNFYGRWRANELRVQAYLDLPDWEETIKSLNESRKPPKVISIDVPYSFATIATIVTYLIHTFAGRKPIFQIGTYKKESVSSAPLMEQVLQYNADHTRLVKHLFQFLQDAEMYGVGILLNMWKEVKAMRTVWRESSPLVNFLGLQVGGGTKQRFREEHTIYAGNEVASIDPFLFFPDPSVPMNEVNRKGEYIFWRTFEGKHLAKKREFAGEIKYVNAVPDKLPVNSSGGTNNGDSSRSLRARGTSQPGNTNDTSERLNNVRQVDRCAINIIPKELGLGQSTDLETWFFEIHNRSQIVAAEPLGYDHGMLPVSVVEPYTLGYGFGHLGIADYLGPTQDTLSWLVNSHIANVRTGLNNMFVVNPALIEMQDMKNPEPGKLIRMKQAAMGQDVRAAVAQLNVNDMTGNHFKDFELFMRIGDTLSSVTDNLRGLQDSGGRKTATEVRTTGEAAASRLAAHARLISAQGMVDLAEQMAINNQQFLEDEFYFQIVGEKGRGTPIHIRPEMLVGDFYYPVHDGTLPLDKVALLDVWKELFLAIAGDPELRSSFSVVKIFEHIAELGGAKNIDSFKLNLQPDGEISPPQSVGDIINAGDRSGSVGGGSPQGGSPAINPQ